MTHAALLAGMRLGTLFSLRHSTDDELIYTTAQHKENEKFSGWVCWNSGRWEPIISTQYVFKTEDEAINHMKNVVKAAREVEINPAEAIGNLGRE